MRAKELVRPARQEVKHGHQQRDSPPPSAPIKDTAQEATQPAGAS
jgi:hypothetical protein